MKRRLSYADRDVFLSEVARLMVDEKRPQRDAVMQAMLTLPEGKRQPSYATCRNAWKTWLDRLIHKAIEDHKKKPVEAPPPPAPERESPPPEPVVVDITQLPADHLVNELVRRMVMNFMGTLQGSISEIMQAQMTTNHTDPPLPLPVVNGSGEPKKRKLRIGIVGLLGPQQQIIVKEFGSDIDVRFLRQQHGDVKLFGDYAHILCMRGMMSHAQTDKIKSMKLPFSMCGGMSELKDKLTDLYIKAGG